MARCAHPIPIIPAVPAILLCAGLIGCADGDSASGRRILAELERDEIPGPREPAEAAGMPERPELPASGPITLADLLAVAEARSPDLAAARSDVGVAAGREWQASLYPNPRVEIRSEDVAFSGGFAESDTLVGVSQPIVIGGRIDAAIRAAGAERAARLAQVEVRRRQLFGEIGAEHARLIAALEQQRLYTDLRDLAGRTVDAAEARFEAGAAPERDVIRPRVELARLDAALQRLEAERTQALRRLELLLGGAAVDASRLERGMLGALPELDEERLREGVRASHPLLLAADREIEAAEARLGQVRSERTPDLEVSVGAGYSGERDVGIAEFGVGADVPLWDRSEGEVLSARFELMGARQRRAAAENELLGRLASALGEYGAARAQLGTFGERIVPDAQRAFDQTSEAYRAGNTDFLDVLDAQRTLADARVTLAELAGAAAVARAGIAAIVGPEGLSPPSADSGQGRSESPVVTERRSGAEVHP